MYPSRFAYQRASSLDEALAVLNEYNEDIKILSGGQSLIPLLKLRLASPPRLLDIGRLKELGGIRRENGSLRIGALTRHVELEGFLPAPGLEIFSEAARVIADPQVRNLGTVGGALAEADPAGDWGAVFLALDAAVMCRSAAGARRLAVRDFFLDAYTTALNPAEILTEVEIDVPAPRTGSAYLKLERKTGDFAIASAGVMVESGARAEIQKIGVGLSGVGLTPLKAVKTESVLRHQPYTPELVEKAGERLMSEIEPLADLRGSSEYKREVARALFQRALALAWERATNI
jgi:carbon-monoxide dehydrogenase medium subunit